MDALTHDFLNSPNPTYDKVLARFGNDLVDTPGGPINRKKLAAIVFSDRQARMDLQAIIHPAVREQCKKHIAQMPSGAIVFVEVPLLFESNLQGDYDETLALLVDPAVQMARLLARPNMDEAMAKKRIAAQLPQQEKARRANSVIENSGTMEEFEAKIDAYLVGVRQRAEAKRTAADKRNGDFRDTLQQFAEMATTQCLDKLGYVGSTEHKEAEACLQLDLSSGPTGAPNHQHELKVDVRMSVKQKRGTPGPCGGCTCGCDNCRDGCACSDGCGCNCPCPTKPPVPPIPPTPPKPPTPPFPPCPDGAGKKTKVWLFLLIIAAICIVLAMAVDKAHDRSNYGGNDPVSTGSGYVAPTQSAPYRAPASPYITPMAPPGSR
jgi:dephospho-CoA kinase